MSTTLSSDIPLPAYPTNLAKMLSANATRFPNQPVYQENTDGVYHPLLWHTLNTHISSIQHTLNRRGLKPGDRVAILSPNCQAMLEMELAIMSFGAVVVPIFAGYPKHWAERLVRFCEPKFVVVADDIQYAKLGDPEAIDTIIHFKPRTKNNSINTVPFDNLLQHQSENDEILGSKIPSDTVCLMMYTSGTMGRPKLVQLTHENILSQQAAMKTLWNLNDKDRFLSYLPWHHSFGGIFEKYAAITNGAVLSLEHGFGKDIHTIIANWEKVKPTVFFSVPRVYQEIANLVQQDSKIEKLIFHDELRFIFTAAAPLPKNISDLFLKHGIPVVEGWGLTETSPCCTITDPTDQRQAGIVGNPIPGITLRLAEDGEILVKGPNVMRGYFKNREATAKVLSRDGWFATGDVGELTDSGLRLISRKDRIFKLSNAKKVVPTEIENLMTKDCAYLAHAYVAGKNHDYPVALLFPNKNMFSQVSDDADLKSGCDCPNNVGDLAHCLEYCLAKTNDMLDFKYYRIKSAMLLDYELSIEKEELTPSMKLAPNVVGEIFKANIEHLYDSSVPVSDDVYVIHLSQ